MGFALEIVKADIIARFWREGGDEVFFNTGTDEHGLKIFREAEKAGVSPQAYVDEYAEHFKALKPALNLSYDNFIRTTDAHHIMAAQAFWKRCAGLVTDHTAFDYEFILKQAKVIFDTRNAYKGIKSEKIIRL